MYYDEDDPKVDISGADSNIFELILEGQSFIGRRDIEAALKKVCMDSYEVRECMQWVSLLGMHLRYIDDRRREFLRQDIIARTTT